MDELDLTPLRNAIRQFSDALVEQGAEPARTLLRDGLIQRFEFTYSLCERMLRRYLEMSSGGRDDVDTMTFPTLIRTASEQNLLLHGWDRWSDFRKAHNKTSHAYSEAIVLEVLEILPYFLTEAKYLLARLSERTA